MSPKVLANCCSFKNEFREPIVPSVDAIATELLQLGRTSIDSSLYVQSGPPLHGSTSIVGACPAAVSQQCSELAAYEYDLLAHIRSATGRPFFLTGAPGSGKTTTLRFLFDNFVESNDLEHCNWGGCNRECRTIYIDFDHTKFTLLSNADEARRVLVDELASRLNAGLAPLLGQDELARFWSWANSPEVALIRPRVAAFREIDKVATQLGVGLDDAQARLQIAAMIAKAPSAWLDLLLCQCHFLATKVLNPNRPCLYIVLDNIDYASPHIQEEVVLLLAMRTIDLRLNIVVGLREETFKRHFVGNLPFEVKSHESAGAVPVLVRRCERFLETYPDGATLLTTFAGLPSAAMANAVIAHLRRLLRVLEVPADRSNVLVEFINAAMGPFVRSSILGAQYLINNRMDFLQAEGLTQHHYLRAFLRYSIGTFDNEYNAPVCNVFHSRFEFRNYPLLKLRILKYLSQIPEPEGFQCEHVVVVVAHLALFDYPELAVRDALVDLASPYHQLVFSTEADWESDERRERRDFLYLTHAGAEYLRRTVHSIDYIGEMIMSCAVDGDSYTGLVGSQFVVERLHAVVRFLKALAVGELSEFRTWVTRCCDASTDFERARALTTHRNAYGDDLLSLEIIIEAWHQLQRIAVSVCQRDPTLRSDFHEIITDYKDALIVATNNNHGYHTEIGIINSGAGPTHTDDIAIKVDEFLHTLKGMAAQG